jgi:uncharacterized damage-inducible protein DinB
MPRDTLLTGGNVLLLGQVLELLERLDDQAFTATTPATPSPVGGHLRHCLEFYRCFLDGLPQGRVDYDGRRRDRSLETDRRRALETLRVLMEQLAELPVEAGERPLLVSSDRTYDPEGAGWTRSTVQREIQFLRSHTIHHFALIAAQLRLLAIDPGDELGVAPSTLEYRRSQKVGAGS